MKSNKVLKIILIVFLSFLTISVTWFMVNVITGRIDITNFRIFKVSNNELILDETYYIDFNKIDIKSSNGDVYIKESANNEVKVIIYADEDKTTVSTNNNELVINIESSFCIGICFNVGSKIEVYLPKGYNKMIKIDNKYGDIEIENFKNATIDINEDSGNVLVQSANVLKINNDYGDIEVGEANDADIHDSAGNISIKSVYNAKVKNEYGNIEIDNIYNSLDIINECGDININNITLNKSSVIKDSLGDIEIGKTNEIYIDAETELGDVKVENNYPKSEVTFKIENECGDIEVNN